MVSFLYFYKIHYVYYTYKQQKFVAFFDEKLYNIHR